MTMFKEKKLKRPMISLCRSAFLLLLLLSLLFFFYFFFLFINIFFSLLKVYEINITIVAMMLNVELISFKIKYIQKSYFKIKLRKRDKSPTC